MAWVGHTMLASEAALRELLEACQTTPDSYYFLRWPSHVSGFVTPLPEGALSPEGQLFKGDRELRWRRQGEKYSALLLTTENATKSLEIQGVTFDAVDGHWEAQTRNAHVHAPTETRLPAVIAANGVDVSQRYFVDKNTATVHFVALVVDSSRPLAEKTS